MSHVRIIAAIILMTFCFGALAQLSEHNMNDKKTIIISYDYPQKRVLEESTAELHKINKFTLHEEGDVDVILLGEKQKIIIPSISESFLLFDHNFQSVELYMLTTSHWSSLKSAIAQINQMKERLEPIKKVAIKSDELDISKLTTKYFGAKSGALISEYELEHYKIFFMIKKLTTPKEVHPRDEDYFQLTIRVDNKII